jgi:hypothetical protein
MRRLLLFALLLPAFLVATAARADGATITFAGTVTSVDAGLSAYFSPGDAISGSYDFTYPVANCGSATECTYSVVTALSVSVDGYGMSYAGSGQNNIKVRNNNPQDLYEVKVNVTGATLGGYYPNVFNLQLVGGTSGLSSTDLPGTMPDSTLFGVNSINFQFCDVTGGCGPAFKATVTGQQVPVPEPATLVLLGLGLGVVGMRLRRKT